MINANKAEITASRYRFSVSPLLVEARKAVPWVDGKRLKEELDAQISKLLGPKTAEDNEKPTKKACFHCIFHPVQCVFFNILDFVL